MKYKILVRADGRAWLQTFANSELEWPIKTRLCESEEVARGIIEQRKQIDETFRSRAQILRSYFYEG